MFGWLCKFSCLNVYTAVHNYHSEFMLIEQLNYSQYPQVIHRQNHVQVLENKEPSTKYYESSNKTTKFYNYVN